MPSWAQGLIFGVLLSLPDAIITKAYAPILFLGAVGADSRFAPAGAIKGDRKDVNWGNGGGWNDATAGSYPDWLQVDFDGTKDIHEIDLLTLPGLAPLGIIN